MSFALSPPVTSYSAPVTSATALEARKTAPGETSSGSSQPTFNGTVSARMSCASCGDGFQADGVGFHQSIRYSASDSSERYRAVDNGN
jgi:hypothetical protein